MGRVQAIRPVLGGVAVVHCVHDRRKREVVTEERVYELMRLTGKEFDMRLNKLHGCSCCENLFVDPASEPQFCLTCRGPLVHALGGPLPEPEGVVG